AGVSFETETRRSVGSSREALILSETWFLTASRPSGSAVASAMASASRSRSREVARGAGGSTGASAPSGTGARPGNAASAARGPLAVGPRARARDPFDAAGFAPLPPDDSAAAKELSLVLSLSLLAPAEPGLFSEGSETRGGM